MKKRILPIVLLITLFCENTLCQISLPELRKKLQSSDSVLLIRHKTHTLEVPDKLHPEKGDLIINGKLNKQVILKKVVLRKKETNYISSIVTTVFNDSIIERARCFIPKYAVLFFKGNKISFINISFQCREFESSDDIQIPENDFDKATWDAIERFFKRKGLTSNTERP